MVEFADIGDFAGKIYSQAQRMIRLIEDIIHLSRLDEGADGMLHEEVDLLILANETAASLAQAAESANVQIAVCGESQTLSGIPQLLSGIIFNLCDNAIKYNRSGGSVSIVIGSSGDNAFVKVSDTGIGIESEHHTRIFERFYRVDKSHSNEVGGTGLGLSIVKHAAKIHDADIN